MTLTIYILIAIPICILTILIWAYFDYQKYKREHHLIILLSFCFPHYRMPNMLTMKNVVFHLKRMRIIKVY